MVSWEFIRDVGPVRWAARYTLLQFRKRILKQDSKLVLPTGATLVLPRQSQTSTEIYVTNANMDWGAEEIFARFADPDRDFLDIGAHIGYYAAYLAPVSRRCYAFEPDKRNLPSLYENAAALRNIEVVEMAVSSQDGVGEFYSGSGSSVGSLVNHGGASNTVQITTVDSFVSGRPGIDVGLVKTDVEGHDFEALQGMDITVRKFSPLILTECELSPELFALCAQWGYRIFAPVKDQARVKFSFRECLPADADRYFAKMIFLVPQRLHSSFVSLIRA